MCLGLLDYSLKWLKNSSAIQLLKGTRGVWSGIWTCVPSFMIIRESIDIVAVSSGYSTCFAVSACDGLCHLTKIMDQIHLGIEA